VTYSLLGSYVVQSDLGDYDADEHRHGTDYIRTIHFAPHQTEELLEKIAELHRTHRSVIDVSDFSRSRCFNTYLAVAEKLRDLARDRPATLYIIVHCYMGHSRQ